MWPHGVKREALRIDAWLKEIAPSEALRSWFGHDPKRWITFKSRYLVELAAKGEHLTPLLDALKKGDVTLVFGAKDEAHNNAVVLRSYLQQHAKK